MLCNKNEHFTFQNSKLCHQRTDLLLLPKQKLYRWQIFFSPESNSWIRVGVGASATVISQLSQCCSDKGDPSNLNTPCLSGFPWVLRALYHFLRWSAVCVWQLTSRAGANSGLQTQGNLAIPCKCSRLLYIISKALGRNRPSRLHLRWFIHSTNLLGHRLCTRHCSRFWCTTVSRTDVFPAFMEACWVSYRIQTVWQWVPW